MVNFQTQCNRGIKEDFLKLKIYLTGIFQNSIKASELTEEKDIDVYDRILPLEEGLISQLVNLIIRDLTNAEYRPADTKNNASDDLENKAAVSKNGNDRQRQFY